MWEPQADVSGYGICWAGLEIDVLMERRAEQMTMATATPIRLLCHVMLGHSKRVQADLTPNFVMVVLMIERC